MNSDGVAETDQGSHKESLEDLDDTNKSVQTSMNSQTMILRLLELLAYDQKDNSLSEPQFLNFQLYMGIKSPNNVLVTVTVSHNILFYLHI